MVRLILNIISSTLAHIYKIYKPVSYYLNRIINLAMAKSEINGLLASVQFDGRIIVTGTCNISIGQETRIGRNVELGTEETGSICIGKKVRVNRGGTIFAYDNITIGDDTMIGEFATIRDANHGIEPGKTVHSQPHQAEAIKIGKDVWIGRGAVILPGVSIGDGSIIGANSVVTKSIPAGVIAVGCPTKVIRER